MPASSEPVIPHQRRYSRSEELSRALSTQLSSNEGEQPVCRSRLIDNRKIEIFKAPALSGPFAYSHSVALSSVVRNASAMSPIGREADIRQNADVNPMHSLRQEAVSHAGRCGARTRSGAPGKSAPVTGRRKMSNAQWRRWQWRTERRKERQLQTRPIHRRGSSDSPLVARGYSYAPRAEQALPMTTEMTDSSIQGQRTLTSVVTFVKFDLQEQIPSSRCSFNQLPIT